MYSPRNSARARMMRDWHARTYAEMQARGDVTLTYLGLELRVPATVFAPTPMSDLLGRAVLEEARPSDRVLDMGTGSGVNAILVASRSTDVVGVDVNPDAVAAARHNAAANGVADRVGFFESDVFDAVRGTFDLMIFDPPFRWFRPRSILEASITDENYAALTRFLHEARAHLKPGGRILFFFGTSGDFEYVNQHIDEEGFARETVATRDFASDGVSVSYFTMRLTPVR